MASLLDLPEIVGFFSYSRKDDQDSEGALSLLRRRIYSELRLQLGRHYRLWQDTAAIPEGSLWQDEIRRAIAESVFFIPIVTPSSLNSKHCRAEFESFRARERALGRSDLIFPILYVTVKELQDEEKWSSDPVLRMIGERQYLDYRLLRHYKELTPEISMKIEQFCDNLSAMLRKPWVAPVERTAPQSVEWRPHEERALAPVLDLQTARSENEAHAAGESRRDPDASLALSFAQSKVEPPPLPLKTSNRPLGRARALRIAQMIGFSISVFYAVILIVATAAFMAAGAAGRSLILFALAAAMSAFAGFLFVKVWPAKAQSIKKRFGDRA